MAESGSRSAAPLIAGLTILICCALAGIYAYTVKPQSLDPAFLFGYNLPPVILGTVIVWLVTRPYRVRLVIPFAAVCLYSVVSAASVSGLQHQSAEGKRQLSELVAAAKESIPALSPSDEHASNGGDVAVVTAFAKRVFAGRRELSEGYLAALTQAGWRQVLEASTYIDDSRLEEARRTISAAREIVREFRKKQIELNGRLMAEAKALQMTPSSHKEFFDNFSAAFEHGQQDLDEFWYVERQIVDAYGEVVEYLVAKRPKWKSIQGKFMFSDDSALAGYQLLASRIDTLQKQETAILKRQAESLTQKLSQLEAMAK